ncbi:ring finger domain-containing protein [Stemphylium lycopersici]|uniref:Ring finger domain-containing protein n=1 Tax=Stemphylium lycopersici TaxID=183478 RepID=A0A364MZK3_STELY|nr:ring finger domain-containing protein [Stemphylium lycopersici]
MSSNPPTASSSKASAPSGPASPAQNQTPSISTGSFFAQQRGSGAPARSSPTPRNSQQQKKQHKGSKRVRATDEDAIAESLAMRPFSNRKGQTSITHLMNFSLPPRPTNHHHQSHGRNYRRNPTWGLGSGYHAVDKARQVSWTFYKPCLIVSRYVHANYRFIVDPRGDYRAQSVDADIHLCWNNVMQILASELSQEASCPICLGTPVAPRMAKCGHIFCLPCLIRYMHSEDDGKPPEKKARSKKCPLCFDIIYASEARPVRWYTGQEGEAPREGGDVVLRLVVRPAGSTLAMPRDGADALSKDEDIPWYHAAEVTDYARVMRGGEDYMLEQFDQEIAKLEQQGQEDEVMFAEDSMEWTKKAIRNITEAKEKFKGIGNPPREPAKPVEAKTKRAPIVFDEEGSAPEMYNIQTMSKSGRDFTPSLSAAESGSASGRDRAMSVTSQTSASNGISFTLAELRNRQQHETNKTPSEYFFYQALLHYYLSPLDIRILKAAFGNFASFPSTILPRVEHVSTGHVVDDELRKRTKYLAHLPYGCEVGFLECDWTDTVAPEILEQFRPEIERRRKKHTEKETKEEKARQRAEKAEYAEFAAGRRRRPSMTERFSADDFQPLASGSMTDAHAVDGDHSSTSPPWPPRRGDGFASLASPSTSPSAPRTVWGTAVVAGKSPVLAPHDQADGDDGWLQGWEKDLLGEDEMLAQAQALSLAEGEEAPKKGGGKKKKGKKITLMSTNKRKAPASVVTHQNSHDNASPTKKRKGDAQEQDVQNIDTSKPTAVFNPTKGRDWTVTIALPGSWTLNAKKPDHKTIQVGRIARAAAIYCVDEIVVFDDDPSNIDSRVVDPKYIRKGRTKAQVLDSILEQDEAWQNPDQFLYHLLSFAECPPHLRYDPQEPHLSIFKEHQNLKWVGNLPSMDMPHHLRSHEWCQYREGVFVGPAPAPFPPASTPKGKKAKKTTPDDQEYAYVKCGLPYPIRVPIPKDAPIEQGMRTTVRFSDADAPPNWPHLTSQDCDNISATACAASLPREEGGYYWGYTVRRAASLGAVFSECEYSGGYDMSIGTSERGQSVYSLFSGANDKPSSTSSSGVDTTPVKAPSSFKHLLIVFGGQAGIEPAVASDPELTSKGLDKGSAHMLFDAWVNLVPRQGSRTIRTEEAVTIGLAALKPWVDGMYEE